jgi:TonB family protein
LAPWARELDDAVRTGIQLPIELRAMAVSGRTMVEFVVHRSGVVGRVRLLESSGNDTLDAHSLAAVPQRLPPPRPLDGDRLRVRYTIHFREGGP